TSSLQDALQAEAEAAMLDHQRVALERERREVGIRINALLWLPPATVLPPPPSELAMPAPPDSSGSLDSLRAQAERARPEVRAAQAAVDAARARLELARRGRLPEVMVEGAFDRFMDRSETRATLGVGMSLPFLSGLSGAAADAASAELAGARHRLDAARNRVGLEVGDALARLAEAHHEVEVMGASVVPTTEQALRAVRANYEANRTDFVVLLNSERDFASARLDYFRALADYGQAHTDLDRAVGLLPPGIPGGGNRDE
ncbi:MAG TPA: TolC family protein, partial [Candidatus Saccharimonadales bacterium]|nr:TolC family protein [Candidatus Saccharimonadales bacterium]